MGVLERFGEFGNTAYYYYMYYVHSMYLGSTEEYYSQQYDYSAYARNTQRHTQGHGTEMGWCLGVGEEEEKGEEGGMNKKR